MRGDPTRKQGNLRILRLAKLLFAELFANPLRAQAGCAINPSEHFNRRRVFAERRPHARTLRPLPRKNYRYH